MVPGRGDHARYCVRQNVTLVITIEFTLPLIQLFKSKNSCKDA